MCGELLLILVPDDVPADSYPPNVHCPKFHAQLALESGGEWPADGRDTFWVEFPVE
ncbi:hypothetical protein ACPCKW_22240 [Streptomyces griseoincarnatus]